MIESSLIARRNATRLLIGPLAALWVSAPLAVAGDDQDKAAAERVAKKVEKAKHKSREAREADEAVRHFEEEVAEYARLHDREVKRVGQVDSEAGQKALAGAII